MSYASKTKIANSSKIYVQIFLAVSVETPEIYRVETKKDRLEVRFKSQAKHLYQ